MVDRLVDTAERSVVARLTDAKLHHRDCAMSVTANQYCENRYHPTLGRTLAHTVEASSCNVCQVGVQQWETEASSR